MAFKQSYAKPSRSNEPNTFAGKYSLRKIAGMKELGDECYVIPLDMQSGYSVLPYHTLKKNGSEGFKGYNFGSAKIACKAYDPETGERLTEEPLCCKLARMEKDRKPEKEDSVYRAISFSSQRFVIPVLVLSSCEDDPKKKPSMRKLSLKNIDFSFLDLASGSYEEDFVEAIVTQLTKDGIIEHRDDVTEEELLELVKKYLTHSIIKVTNAKSSIKGIPYVKSFDLIPSKNEFVGKDSGEGGAIQWLCNLMAGGVDPSKLDKLYEKYPVLKVVNNQVLDYLTVFNDNVDSLVVNYTDSELQKYYNDFVNKQEVTDEYREYNDKARANADEEVSFMNSKATRTLDDEDEFGVQAEFPGEPIVVQRKAATATVEKPFTVAAPVSTENFDTADLEESSVLSDVDFSDDDFELDEDDIENFGFEG